MTAWSWLGDHLALDFANTIRWSASGGREELWAEPADVVAWLDALPEDVPRPQTVNRRQWLALQVLRDHTVALLEAAVAGQALPAASVDAVNDTVRKTSTSRLLTDRARVAVAESAAVAPVDALRGRLAEAVVDLLAREDLANLARCAAPGCGQFFHRSRPNQRWCSPGCGNRARVDRHRHRRPRGPRP